MKIEKTRIILFLISIMGWFILMNTPININAATQGTPVNSMEEWMDSLENSQVDAEGVNIKDLEEAEKKGLTKFAVAGDEGTYYEGSAKIYKIAKNISNIMSAVLFGLAVVLITYAGYAYTTSEGDPRKTDDAKRKIMVAGIGLILGIMSNVILNIFISVIYK